MGEISVDKKYVATLAPLKYFGNICIPNKKDSFKAIVWVNNDGEIYDDRTGKNYKSLLNKKEHPACFADLQARDQKNHKNCYYIIEKYPLDIHFPYRKYIDNDEAIEFLNKINNIKNNEYKSEPNDVVYITTGLYIAFTAFAYVENGKDFISKDGIYNIVKKDIEDRFIGVFNNIYYRYFYNYRLDRSGKLYVHSLIPIEKYFPGRKTVTKTELIQLRDKLNNVQKIEEKEETNVSKITINDTENKTLNDRFLKEILKTKEKIENQQISDELKIELTSKLMELGSYYMESLIEYNEKPSMLDFQSYKYKIMCECITKLVEIEFIVKEYFITGYDSKKLETELEEFKKRFKC